MLKKFADILLNPKNTLKEEKSNPDIKYLIKILIFAGLVAGIMYIAFMFLNVIPSPTYLFHNFNDVILYAMLVIFIPLNAIICIAIMSIILYVFAKIFNGHGDLTVQTHLIALSAAPIIMISPFFYIPLLGVIIAAAAFVYFLYLLTLALKETHNYKTINAVLTWIIPFSLCALIFLLLMFASQPHHNIDPYKFINKTA